MGLSLTVSELWTQNHFVTDNDTRERSDKGDATDGVALKINAFQLANSPVSENNVLTNTSFAL
jgi:hypothetical protein